FTMLNGIVALAMKRERERLMAMSTVLLYPGVVLLGIGIFAGAVWANVSWGRYWGWDPKETWALITFLVYAVPLHTSIAKLRTPLNFHIYLILAFLTVIMTYFGVNLLPSLHAY
ncbi:cytochrome c biogenesis protein, partial [uncultured Muribaculum sp.]